MVTSRNISGKIRSSSLPVPLRMLVLLQQGTRKHVYKLSGEAWENFAV